jgi:hypothetical protein
MALIPVRNATSTEMPISKNTAYKWHSMKKHPNLIYKVGGKLFFDSHEWQKMADKAKKEQIKTAKALRKI